MTSGSLQPTPSLSRRALLTAISWLASATTLLGLSGVRPPSVRASAQAQQLAGSWLVTGGRNSTPNDLNTFFSDGNMVGANTEHLTRTPNHGAWVRTGDRQFAYTHWRFLFDASGAWIGTRKVRGQLTLHESLNEYTAQTGSETYDLEGTLVQATNLTRRGQRITVEPLP